MKFINIKSPISILSIVFLTQYLLWFLFFPESPTVIDGEPRHQGLTSHILLIIIYICTILGMYLGSRTSIKSLKKNIPISLIKFFEIAKFLFWISLIFNGIKFYDLIISPSLIFNIFEPYGTNKLHSDFSESAPGISTLAMLWLFSAPIFSMIYFSSTKINYKNISFYFYFLMLVVFIVSTINMTRTVFIVLILLYFGGYLVVRNYNKIKIRYLFYFVISILLIVWIGSILRTGIVLADAQGENIFSWSVQSILVSEFVEKYSSGELNNSLIMLTYDTDISKNYAYSTIFHAFTNPFSPDRFLNTQLIFSLWYWQFGLIGSIIFSIIFGIIIGSCYNASKIYDEKGVLNFGLFLYLFAYPGFYMMSRINYYMLIYFLLPVLILFFIAFIFKMLRKKRFV
jgi:oligosaccharide repeat unit polymerase